MSEVRRRLTLVDYRLLPVALAVWAGSWWGTGGGRAPLVICIVAVLSAVCTLGVLVVKKPRREARHAKNPLGSCGAGALVLACAVAVSTGIALAHRQAFDASDTVNAAQTGARVSITARLEEDPVPLRARSGVSPSRARAQVLATGEGSHERAYVRVLVVGDLADVRRGDTVEVRGVVDSSSPQGPAIVGVVKDEQISLVERPGGWRTIVRYLRERLREACAGLDEQGRALVPGMAIGDDRAMGADLRKAFRAASLSHLTAVSGSHLAIVLGVAPYLLPRSRKGRIVGMGLVLLSFVALVGATPAVLRAALSSGSALVGALFGRNGQGGATLGTVVTGMLLVDPWCSRDFGFALSVAATFGVLIPAQAWLRTGRTRLRDDTRLGRVAARLLALVAVPAWCAIMTAPILFTMNPRLPLYSIMANIMAGPAVAPATLLSLGTALVAPVCMPAALVLARISSLCTAWIAFSARSVASLPGAYCEASRTHLVVFGVLAVLCACVLIRRRAQAQRRRLLRVPKHVVPQMRALRDTLEWYGA